MGFQIKCVRVLDKAPCCCCSCDLKVATCILGWIGLVEHVLGFLTTVISLAMFDDSKVVQPQESQYPVQASQSTLIVYLIVFGIGVLIVSLLLYGAHYERQGFMLPYLIISMISIVVLALGVVVISIILFLYAFLVGLAVLVVGGLYVVLECFFWVIIYSYYRKLEERQYPLSAAPHGNILTV